MKPVQKRRARTEAAPVGDAKGRLLAAAIDVFGRNGYEASTTRMLAEAADVNLQSIPYYFGGKAGLYLAAADHIAARVLLRVEPLTSLIVARLSQLRAADERLTPDEARALLLRAMTTMAHLFLRDESEPWARFVIREQMQPTAAFDRLYERVLSPLLELVRTLLGAALGRDPNSEAIRLRAIANMGQLLVLRAARATLMRQLAWSEVGPAQVDAVDVLVEDLVQALVPGPRPLSQPPAPNAKTKRKS